MGGGKSWIGFPPHSSSYYKRGFARMVLGGFCKVIVSLLRCRVFQFLLSFLPHIMSWFASELYHAGERTGYFVILLTTFFGSDMGLLFPSLVPGLYQTPDYDI